MIEYTTSSPDWQAPRVYLTFDQQDKESCGVMHARPKLHKGLLHLHIFAPLEVVLTITAGTYSGIVLAHSGPRGSDVFWHTVNCTREDSPTLYEQPVTFFYIQKYVESTSVFRWIDGLTWPLSHGTIRVKCLVQGHEEPAGASRSRTQNPEHQSPTP